MSRSEHSPEAKDWRERAEAAEAALKSIEGLLGLANAESLDRGNLHLIREAYNIARAGGLSRFEHSPEAKEWKAEYTCQLCKRLFGDHTWEEYVTCMDAMFESAPCEKCGRPFWAEHKPENKYACPTQQANPS